MLRVVLLAQGLRKIYRFPLIFMVLVRCGLRRLQSPAGLDLVTPKFGGKTGVMEQKRGSVQGFDFRLGMMSF